MREFVSFLELYIDTERYIVSSKLNYRNKDEHIPIDLHPIINQMVRWNTILWNMAKNVEILRKREEGSK